MRMCHGNTPLMKSKKGEGKKKLKGICNEKEF
jgi:hypothetical protein